MMARRRWVRQLSKNSVEVMGIDDILNHNTPSQRTFTVILKGSNDNIVDTVQDAIGLDVRKYDHTVDNYFTSHAIREHRNDIISLRLSDYQKIQAILKTANRVYWDDGVENSGKNRDGLPKSRNGVVKYEKTYKRGRLVYIEEVRKSRHELAAKTMYWQATKKIAPRSPRTLI